MSNTRTEATVFNDLGNSSRSLQGPMPPVSLQLQLPCSSSHKAVARQSFPQEFPSFFLFFCSRSYTICFQAKMK